MKFPKNKFFQISDSKDIKVGDILFEEIKVRKQTYSFSILIITSIYTYSSEENICIDTLCLGPWYKGREGKYSFNTNFKRWSNKVYKLI